MKIILKLILIESPIFLNKWKLISQNLLALVLKKNISINPKKPHPIKIVLNNTLEVYSSLRLQANLRKSTAWFNICISSDRTYIQRKQMNILRQELQKRKDDGEKNIIIKYIKGTPKIVTIQKFF
jgi:hypothetical protein